jgi:hypothetical protein
MTYDEFQVYFHAFNNAYSVLVRTGGLAFDQVEKEADRVANKLTDKYKSVEKPNVPDLTSAMENVIKGLGKTKR